MNKLTLVEVNVRKVVTIQDSRLHFAQIGGLKDLLLWAKGKAKIGKRVGVYSFNAAFVAWIDLSEVRSEDVTYTSDGILTLSLPPIQTELLGRDFTLNSEYERVDGLRDAITPEDRARAKEYATRRLRQEVLENSAFISSVQEQAQEKLRKTLVNLLLLKGEENPAVQIRYTAAPTAPAALPTHTSAALPTHTTSAPTTHTSAAL